MNKKNGYVFDKVIYFLYGFCAALILAFLVLVIKAFCK